MAVCCAHRRGEGRGELGLPTFNLDEDRRLLSMLKVASERASQPRRLAKCSAVCRHAMSAGARMEAKREPFVFWS